MPPPLLPPSLECCVCVCLGMYVQTVYIEQIVLRAGWPARRFRRRWAQRAPILAKRAMRPPDEVAAHFSKRPVSSHALHPMLLSLSVACAPVEGKRRHPSSSPVALPPPYHYCPPSEPLPRPLPTIGRRLSVSSRRLASFPSPGGMYGLGSGRSSGQSPFAAPVSAIQMHTLPAETKGKLLLL